MSQFSKEPVDSVFKLSPLVTWEDQFSMDKQTQSVYISKISKVGTCWLQIGKQQYSSFSCRLRKKGMAAFIFFLQIYRLFWIELQENWLYWSHPIEAIIFKFTCKATRILFYPVQKEKFLTKCIFHRIFRLLFLNR